MRILNQVFFFLLTKKIDFFLNSADVRHKFNSILKKKNNLYLLERILIRSISFHFYNIYQLRFYWFIYSLTSILNLIF